MASPKTGQSTKPSKRTTTQTHVVVITNSTLSQVVCGPFSNEKAAEKYAAKLNEMQASFQAVAAPITPQKVVNDYLKASH